MPCSTYGARIRRTAPDVEAVRHDAWRDEGTTRVAGLREPHSLDEPAPLALASGDRVIVKPQFSAFFSTNLDNVLRRRPDVGSVLTHQHGSTRTASAPPAATRSRSTTTWPSSKGAPRRAPAVQAAGIGTWPTSAAQMITCDEFCKRGRRTCATCSPVATADAGAAPVFD